MSQLGRDQKKEVLLKAAGRCFLQHGYRRTSIEDVAREAGVAKGTVYLYFQSKEEVFRAVSAGIIGEYMEGARRAAASEGTVAERLAAALEAKFVKVHVLSSSSPHGKELIDSSLTVSGDLYRDSKRAFVKVLASILEDVPLTLPPTEAAWMVFRSASGAGFSEEPPPPSEATVKKRLRALAEVMVRGLQPEEGLRPRAAAGARTERASTA